jgi:hypothetical protein
MWSFRLILKDSYVWMTETLQVNISLSQSDYYVPNVRMQTGLGPVTNG